MSEYNKYIGRHIVTSNAGIGEITYIEKINEEEFFKVTFPSVNTTNYFSINNNGKYRFVSSENEIKEAIEIFKSKQDFEDFPSIKDKIDFYKKTLNSDKTATVAKSLSVLNSEEEVHISLKKMFEKALESFVQEIVFVLKINSNKAWILLGLDKKK